MKLKSILLVSAVALCLTACSDDKDLPSVADIAGNYSGYTLASCAYFSNSCTSDEAISISENSDGTAKITFESNSWGSISILNAHQDQKPFSDL